MYARFLFLILTLICCSVRGDIVWNWGSGGYSGTLTTDGTFPVSGVYDILDFEVLESADPGNFPRGSVSNGVYEKA